MSENETHQEISELSSSLDDASQLLLQLDFQLLRLPPEVRLAQVAAMRLLVDRVRLRVLYHRLHCSQCPAPESSHYREFRTLQARLSR